MKKICLVTVNAKKKNYGITASTLTAIAPNIPMGLLDSYLEHNGIETVVIDSDRDNLTIKELIDEIHKYNPVLVGVIATGSNPSASTMSMVGVVSFFAELTKTGESDFKTFVWGPHPTVLPERTLRETSSDFVIIGEGYNSIIGLYNHIVKNKKLSEIPGVGYLDGDNYLSNQPESLVILDDLPSINYEKMQPSLYRAHNWHCFGDIDNRTPYAIIWTNQGCPYPCDFCCINNLYQKRTFRFRSMQRVVNDIDVLVNKYNVKNIKILDELFVIDHPRISEFCDLLEERAYDINLWAFARVDSVNPEILQRLRKVGLRWIAYGFETIDDNILDATNKRLKSTASAQQTVEMTRDADINICADAIVGLWDDDRDSIYKTRDFLLENKFEWINLYPAFAYPGTPLYDNAIKDNIIAVPEKWDSYGLYSYDCDPMPTKYLTSSEVLQLRDKVYSDYFKHPDILTMISNKFGNKTKKHVEELVSEPLTRKIVEQSNK